MEKQVNTFKKIICVDFDGVIHSYTSGWKGIDVIPDKPVEGAIKWLEYFAMDSRFEIHIYSSRSKEESGRKAMYNWLQVNGLGSPYIDFIKFSQEKPAAWLTIDDRAICFKGEFPTADDMNNFKPWYK